MSGDDSARLSAGHPAPARGHASDAALWFGIFAAPAAWSVQTLLNYALAAHGCYPALDPRATPTFSGMWTVALLVSVAATAIGVVAGLLAYREWTRTRGEVGRADDRRPGRQARAPGSDRSGPAGSTDVGSALEIGEGRTRFMAMSGILTSLVFVAASLMHALALFLVQPCGQ